MELLTIELPKSLVDELALWQRAFSAAYGKPMSYEDMIRGMLDSLIDTEPAVIEEMERIVNVQPNLAEKLGTYNG